MNRPSWPQCLSTALLLVLSAVATAQETTPECFVFTGAGNFTVCSPDGFTADTATSLENGPVVWFSEVEQEMWFTSQLQADSNVVWQLYSVDGGPYLESTVFANEPVTPALAYLRHADRDPNAVEVVDRFDLGAHRAGTTLYARVRVLEWPDAGQAVVVRPQLLVKALADLPQASNVCGENCEALCEVWGGIDLQREAEQRPTFGCNPNLAPVDCQCFCTDFTVGDVDGSASCDYGDDDLTAGAIVGIVLGTFVFVALVLGFIGMRLFGGKRAVAHQAETRQAPTPEKDDSHTELDTERPHDEENPTKTASPAELWDTVLQVPHADVVYTKVTQLTDGSILVKRKFRLHSPNEKGKTSQRMKLLFPDATTAAHHGFVPTFKKSMEPSETTESESEREDNPIEEIPSILSPKKKSSKKKLRASTQRVVDKIEKHMAEDRKNKGLA